MLAILPERVPYFVFRAARRERLVISVTQYGTRSTFHPARIPKILFDEPALSYIILS
jgi:hypothetical protein